MKLKRKIVMLLALVMAVATVFSVMAINASAEENATDYGPYGKDGNEPNISNADAVTTKNYMVFIKAPTATQYTYISGAGTLVTALNTARNNIALEENRGGTVWIHVTADATKLGDNAWNTANSISGTLVIDFNGHSVDTGGKGKNNSNINYMMGFYDTSTTSVAEDVRNNLAGYTTNVKFLNGTILTTVARPIIDIQGTNTDYFTGTKNINVEFNNMTFSRSTVDPRESAILMVQVTNSSDTVGYDANTRVNANIEFNDCTFSYTNDPDRTGGLDNITFLKDTTGSDADGDFVNVTMSFNGTGINANDQQMKTLKFCESSGNDQIIFEKDANNNYLTATVPTTNTIPTVTGVDMAFVKASATDTTVTYKLMPSAVANFAPKSNITLWSDFGYNIYLPKVDELNYVAVNGVEKTIADLALETLGEVQYYKIAVPVKSFEALNDIAVTVKLTANGENYGGTFNFSVYGYATTVIAGDYAEAEKTLAKDMLSYSAAAYVNFEKESARLADVTTLLGADYDAEYVPAGTAKAPAEGVVTGFTGVTLYLGETPTFRFTFDGATAPTYKYYMGSQELEAKVVVDEEANKGYVDIAVYAHMMTRDLTVKDAETETEIFTYNVFDYYTKAEGNVKELVERLIKYAESAKAYRDTFQVAE